MPRLPAGLYDTPITEETRRLLRELDPAAVSEAQLRAEDAPSILSRHVHDRVIHALRAIPKEAGVPAQVALANRLIALLAKDPESGALVEDRVEPPGKALLEVADPETKRLGTLLNTPRPRVPLRTSEVLMNSHKDLALGPEVNRELASADRVDLLCSFLKFSGYRLLRDTLRTFMARRPRALRILTTTYMGATERRALDALAELGAQIRVSYDQESTRLHAKAWLFHRVTGLTTGIIGSSNLSAAAMLDGLEWNVRLSAVDNPQLLEKFAATFEQYWAANDFEDYDPARFDAAVKRSVTNANPLLKFVDVKPRPHQQEMLDALDVERANGHTRNLVVAATGTGKTVVAALDYRRLCVAGEPPPTLLFVAHRKEILTQARDTYRAVLRDASFGELLVGDDRPVNARHVFASIQSLSEQDRIPSLRKDAYDVVVVDEFHHAAAKTYRDLLEHLKPRFLLGLTATPERTDGQSVLEWFDGRVAAELRLWKALDDGLLSPFQYFGVADGVSLRDVKWSSGRYDPAALEKLYTADGLWARKVLAAVRDYVATPGTMRALGFCVTKGHAAFMAKQFTDAGLPSAAVVAETSAAERKAVLAALSNGELRCVFCVDVFNEGVDLPNVDTLLMLRPTESATLFLQQLGRGLRKAADKACLTVLDFIGDANRKFSFADRYQALVGGTRRDVERAVEGGFPRLPPGCAITLEQQAQEAVLANIRASLDRKTKELVKDLKALGPETTLPQYLAATGMALEEFYVRDRTFTQLRREAGFEGEKSEAEEAVESSLARLLHVDDPLRLATWRGWLENDAPPKANDGEPLQRMLVALLNQGDRPLSELKDTLRVIWSAGPLRNELCEVFGLLADQLRHKVTPLDGQKTLHLHATYSSDEIMAAFDQRYEDGRIARWREGVKYLKAQKLDILKVTLEKTPEDYSPSTLYDDRPLSARLFHWQSQSTTSDTSDTGQRYIHHANRGSRVLLFVRQRIQDARGMTSPFLCLGYVKYVSHVGSRPMNVTWELEREMPAWFYQETKVAAA